MVDWLWDGFNALVLSYGQAEAGKTSLLLGRDSSPSCSSSASGAEKQPAPAAPTVTGRETADHDNDEQSKHHPSEHVSGHSLPRAAEEPPDCLAGQRSGGSGDSSSERRPGGLLEDILRSLFDRVLAARRGVVRGDGAEVVPGGSAAVPAGHGDAADTFATAEGLSPASRGGAENDYTQPRWSSTRESGNPSMSAVLNSSTTNEARHDIVGGHDGGVLTTDVGKQYTIAFSAWDVFGKKVRDLLSPAAGATGAAASIGGASACSSQQQHKMQESGGVGNSLRPGDQSASLPLHVSENRDTICNTRDGRGAETNPAVSSRSSSSSRSTSSSNDKPRKGTNSGGAGGGRGVGSTPRRSRRRGRSGSADNSATNSTASRSGRHPAGGNNAGQSSGTGVWGGPPGYPEGFETVQVSDLPTALALLDKARRRSKEERAGSGGRGGGGVGKEGGGRRGSGGGGGTAEETVCPAGHIFFRVVLYSAEEETVSTLHVVDLAGGWKVRPLWLLIRLRG